MLHTIISQSETAKTRGVCVQYRLIFTGRNQKTITFIRFVRAEIENKQKEDLAEESSQELQTKEPALQEQNDETTKETTTPKKGRKTKKKPTPISEQAIPLPAPEAKPTTI